MAWWNRRKSEKRSVSISDPALLAMLGYGLTNTSGQVVSEHTALTLSAVYRAVTLIAGTIATLPLRTLRDSADGTRERVVSFLDSPAGPDRLTRFEWTELVMIHLLLHGNAYLQHVYNAGGALIGLNPIHPSAVAVEADLEAVGGKLFRVTLENGTTRVFDGLNMTHLTGPMTDGLVGLSPITMARNSFGTAIAGDRAAGRMFANGALISGMVTTEDDVTEDEALVIKRGLRTSVQGEENAGDVAFINRNLKFTPWQLSPEDAQFLQSRAFQIEEVGRWYGVPPHLLGQSEKSTSWGTGIEEQNRGLARYTLAPWTERMQQRLSRLIGGPRFVEFDYSALLQPSPEVEIGLLVQQVTNGILTPNEARRIRNLPPAPNGDTLRLPPGSADPGAAPAADDQEVPVAA